MGYLYQRILSCTFFGISHFSLLCLSLPFFPLYIYLQRPKKYPTSSYSHAHIPVRSLSWISKIRTIRNPIAPHLAKIYISFTSPPSRQYRNKIIHIFTIPISISPTFMLLSANRNHQGPAMKSRRRVPPSIHLAKTIHSLSFASPELLVVELVPNRALQGETKLF